MEVEVMLLVWLEYKDIDNGRTNALILNSSRTVILRKIIWAITDTFINFLLDTDLNQTSTLKEKMGLHFSLLTVCHTLLLTCSLI